MTKKNNVKESTKTKTPLHSDNTADQRTKRKTKNKLRLHSKLKVNVPLSQSLMLILPSLAKHVSASPQEHDVQDTPNDVIDSEEQHSQEDMNLSAEEHPKSDIIENTAPSDKAKAEDANSEQSQNSRLTPSHHLSSLSHPQVHYVPAVSIPTISSGQVPQPTTHTPVTPDLPVTFLPEVISGKYGELHVDANGHYTFVLNPLSPQYVLLHQNQPGTDQFMLHLSNGSQLVVQIPVAGKQDTPTISGDLRGVVIEDHNVDSHGLLSANGKIDVVDPDHDQSSVTAETITGQYGSLSIDANGKWHYQVDNSLSNVQALTSLTSLHESFTIHTKDGTPQTIEMTIGGNDDNAIVSGVDTGSVTEDQTTQVHGQLTVTDSDLGQDHFQASLLTGQFGTLVLSKDGAWTYNLDNWNPTVQKLAHGSTATDIITVHSADGTAHQVTVTINGTNDQAVITSSTAGSPNSFAAIPTNLGSNHVTEDLNTTVLGQLNITDVDSNEAHFSNSDIKGLLGTLHLKDDGGWRYDLDNKNPNVQALGKGSTATDTITIHSADGTPHQITITVNGTNDKAIIGGTSSGAVTEESQLQTSGTLTVTDVDTGEAHFSNTDITGALGTLHLTDTGGWTYDLDNTNPTVQALGKGAAATDTITVHSADGTPHQVTITINGTNDAAVIAGTNTGTVTEESQLQASGTLTVTDVDTGQAHFSNTDITGALGTLHLTDSGKWTYDLDNTNSTVQALSKGATATDTIAVHSADGTPHQVTITINGTDDKAVIGGTNIGGVTEESQLHTSGTLTVTDVDTGEAHFSNTDIAGALGTLHLTDSGKWTYDLDNTNPTVQALGKGATATDTIIVHSADGTPHQVTITVNGTNDAAVIAGTNTGAVTEESQLQTSGTLTVTDVDTGQAHFSNSDIVGALGTLHLTDTGGWTYDLDNTNPTVQALSKGATATDTITVQSADGTPHQVTITVNGTNDKAVIGGTSSGAVTEESLLQTSGTLTITDVDTGEAHFSNTDIAGVLGTLHLTDSGKWTYDLDNTNPTVQALGKGATATDTITVHSADGTPHQVTITVNGTNDKAVIGGTSSGAVTEESLLQTSGTLTITDVDTGEAHFSNTDIVGALGTLHLTDTGGWTYDLDNSNSTVQALGKGATATDTITVQSADGTPHQVTITVNGTNDKAVIGGTSSGAVTEESQLQTSGTLTVTDVDTGEAHFSNNDIAGALGTLHLTDSGKWTYDLDNTNPTVQALGKGATATDTITVHSADGTPHQITITVNGTDDTAVIGGQDTGSVDEGHGHYSDMSPDYGKTQLTSEALYADGKLTIADPDTGDNEFDPKGGGYDYQGQYGRVNLHQDGTWHYMVDIGHNGSTSGTSTTSVGTTIDQLGDGQSLTDTITVYSKDGTSHDIVVTIHGDNDRPYISSEVTLATGTEDTALTFTKADLLANTVDVDANDAGKLSITNLLVDHGSVVDNKDGTYTFTPTNNYNGQVHFSYDVTDAHGGLTHTGATTTLAAVDDKTIISGVNHGVATEDIGTHMSTNVNIMDAVDWQALQITDVDSPNTQVTIEFAGKQYTWDLGSDLDVTTPYGKFQFHTIASGPHQGEHSWSYIGDNNNVHVQELKHGESLTESIKLIATDGTEFPITVKVNGTEDGIVIASKSELGHVVENAQTGASVAGNVVAHDVDLHDTVSWTQTPTGGVSGKYGTFHLASDGQWHYDVDQSKATKLGDGDEYWEHFTVEAVSTDGSHVSKSVSVVVHGNNDAPTVSGEVTLPAGKEDTSIHITQAQLIANTTDVDSNDRGWLHVQNLTVDHGSLVANSDGSFTFHPDPNYNGSVHFSYDVADRHGGITHTGATTILTPSADSALITEVSGDHQLQEDLKTTVTGQLAVIDPDVGEAEFIATSGTSRLGTYNIDATGKWNFNLDPNYQSMHNIDSDISQDTFVVTSKDGTTHTVTLTIRGNEDNATIDGIAVGSVTEDGQTYASGKLNVHDLDWGDTGVDYTNYPGVSGDNGYGVFKVDQDGTWKFTLDNNNPKVQALGSNEQLTETYTVYSIDHSATKQLTVTIHGTNDAPVVSSEVSLNSGSEDTGMRITSAQLLANATDIDANDLNQLSVNNLQADHGSIVDNGNGTFTFTPDADYNGQVHFTYDVKDAHGGITHTGANTTLAATPDKAIISEVTTGSVTEDGPHANHNRGTTTELANGQLQVIDPDSGEDKFQYSQFGETCIHDPFGGMLRIDSAGNWGYSVDNAALQHLAQGQIETVTYRVHSFDGTAYDLNIDVVGTNDAPTVTKVVLSNGTEDTHYQMQASQFGFTDVDTGDTLHSIAITDLPPAAQGKFVFDGHDIKAGQSITATDISKLQFIPAQNFNGDVQFKYTVNDGTVDSTEATDSLHLNAVNDGPTVSNSIVDAGATAENTDMTFTETQLLALVHATDVDTGDSLSVSDVNIDSAIGSFTKTPAGDWLFHPVAHVNATDAPFTISVTDGHVTKSVDATASLDITAVTDPAVITLAPSTEHHVVTFEPGTPGFVISDGVLPSGPLMKQVSFEVTMIGSGKPAPTNGDPTLMSYSIKGDDNALLLTNPHSLAVWIHGTKFDTHVDANDGHDHRLTVSWNADTGSLKLFDNGQVAYSSLDQIPPVEVAKGGSLATGGVLAFGEDQDAVNPGVNAAHGFHAGDGDSFSGTIFQGSMARTIIPDADVAKGLLGQMLHGHPELLTHFIMGAGGALTDTTGNYHYGIGGNAHTESMEVSLGAQPPEPGSTIKFNADIHATDPQDKITSVLVSGLAKDTVLSDGHGHSHISTGFGDKVDVTSWDKTDLQAAFDHRFNSNAYVSVEATTHSPTGDKVVTAVMTVPFKPADVSTDVAVSVDATHGNEDGNIDLLVHTVDIQQPNANIDVVISHLPAGSVLSAGTHDGNGNWHLTTAQLIGLQITPPKDFNGGIDPHVVATSTRIDGSHESANADGRVNVVAVADSATFSGDDKSTEIHEDNSNHLYASGQVIHSNQHQVVVHDPDAGENFIVSTGKTTTTAQASDHGQWVKGDGGVGEFVVNADGTWSYRIDNTNTVVQSLTSGDKYTDTITIHSKDGTSHTLTVEVAGTDDKPTITVGATQTVTEDGIATATGTIATTDVDTGDSATMTAITDQAGTYGHLTIATDGQWTYTLDNNSAQVQGLTQGQVETDTFTLTSTSTDGSTTTEQLVINVTGTNEIPTVTATNLQTTEDISGGQLITKAQLLAGSSDIDGNALDINSVSVNGGHTTLTDNLDGTWTLHPDSNFKGDIALSYNVSDGHANVANHMTVSVASVTDAADISLSVSSNKGLMTDSAHHLSIDALHTPDGSSGRPTGTSLTIELGITLDKTETYHNSDVIAQYGTHTPNSADAQLHYFADGAVYGGGGGLTLTNPKSVTIWVSGSDPIETHIDLTDGKQHRLTVVVDNDNPPGKATTSIFDNGQPVSYPDGTTSESMSLHELGGSGSNEHYVGYATPFSRDFSYGGGHSTVPKFIAERGGSTELSVGGGRNPISRADGQHAVGYENGHITWQGGSSQYGDNVPPITPLVATFDHVSVSKDALTAAQVAKGPLGELGLPATDVIIDLGVTGGSLVDHSGHHHAIDLGNQQLADDPHHLTINASVTPHDVDDALLSIHLQGLPIGTTVSDGTHTHTIDATDQKGGLDIKDWKLGSLDVQIPTGVNHNAVISLNAVTQNADGTTAHSESSAPVILDPAHAGDIIISAPPIYGVEDQGPYDLNLMAIDPTDTHAAITFAVSGLPAGATLSSGSYDSNTNTWTITHSEANGLQITLPKDFSGSVTPHITASSSAGHSHSIDLSCSITNMPDAAMFSGDDKSTEIHEENSNHLYASGQVIHSNQHQVVVHDPDAGENFIVSTGKTTTTAQASDHGQWVKGDGGVGEFVVNADGTWDYRIDNTNTAVQSLTSGDKYTDTITIHSKDGTSHTLTVEVAGTDDKPTITVGATQTVTEDGIATATGTIATTDVDTGDSATMNAITDQAGTYGHLTMATDGQWTYTLDNNSAQVQGLTQGQVETDTFTLTSTSTDGSTTTEQLVINVTGTNDAPILHVQEQSFNDDNHQSIDITLPSNLFVDPEGNAITYSLQMVTVSGTSGLPNWLTFDSSTLKLTGTPPAEISGDFDIRVTATDTHGASNHEDFHIAVQQLEGDVKEDGRAQNHQLDATGQLDAYHNGQHIVWHMKADGSDSLNHADGQYGHLSVSTGGTWHYVIDHDGSAHYANSDLNALRGGQVAPDSFTLYGYQNGQLIKTEAISIQVEGTNDAPTITGISALSTDEKSIVSGKLAITDVDTGEAFFTSQTITSTHGEFIIEKDGNWHFTPNQAAQSLTSADTVVDKVEVTSVDGTKHSLSVTVNGLDTPADPHPFKVTGLAHDTGSNHHDYITSDGCFILHGTGFPGAKVYTMNMEGTVQPDGTWTVDASMLDHPDGTYAIKVFQSGGPNGFDTITQKITVETDLPTISINPISTDDWIDAQENHSELIISGSTSNVVDGNEIEITLNNQNYTATVQSGHWQLTVPSQDITNIPDNAYQVHAELISLANANTATQDRNIIVSADMTTLHIAEQVTEDTDIVANGQIFAHGATCTIANTGQMQGNYGVLTIQADGSYHYQLDNQNPIVQALSSTEQHSDNFYISYQDQHGALRHAVLDVGVHGTNDAPLLTGTFEITRDINPGSMTGTHSFGYIGVSDADSGEKLIAEYIDQDGLSHSIDLQSPEGTKIPVQGLGYFKIEANGKWNFTLSGSGAIRSIVDHEVMSGKVHTESVQVSLTDSAGVTRHETLTVHISGDATTPRILGSSQSVMTEDKVMTSTGLLDLLVGSVKVPAGVSWQVAPGTTPIHGDFSIDTNGQWHYTAHANDQSIQHLAEGERLDESITLIATDSKGNHASVNVNLAIVGTNDTPSITHQNTGSVVEDHLLTLTQSQLLANVGDLDSKDHLSINNIQLVSGGSIKAEGDHWVIQPDANFDGNLQINYNVNDGHVDVANSIAVTVTPDADTPILFFTKHVNEQSAHLSSPDISGLIDSDLALNIHVGSPDSSETLTVEISGVPSGIQLSAGTENNGIWTLTENELTNLKLTPPSSYTGDFNIDVKAISHDGASTSEVSQQIGVHVTSLPAPPVQQNDEPEPIVETADITIQVFEDDIDQTQPAAGASLYLQALGIESTEHSQSVLSSQDTPPNDMDLVFAQDDSHAHQETGMDEDVADALAHQSDDHLQDDAHNDSDGLTDVDQNY